MFKCFQLKASDFKAAAAAAAKSLQSCLTLRDPMDCSLPGSSTHRIFQARVLEWGATVIYFHGSSSSVLYHKSVLKINLNNTS